MHNTINQNNLCASLIFGKTNCIGFGMIGFSKAFTWVLKITIGTSTSFMGKSKGHY